MDKVQGWKVGMGEAGGMEGKKMKTTVFEQQKKLLKNINKNVAII